MKILCNNVAGHILGEDLGSHFWGLINCSGNGPWSLPNTFDKRYGNYEDKLQPLNMCNSCKYSLRLVTKQCYYEFNFKPCK